MAMQKNTLFPKTNENFTKKLQRIQSKAKGI
jgi:hypothetical protein